MLPFVSKRRDLRFYILLVQKETLKRISDIGYLWLKLDE